MNSSRTLAFFSFALFATTLTVACGGDDGVGPPTIASVGVSPASDTLGALGATQRYTAVARDASGAEIQGAVFTWSSSAPGVATIDSATGIATARSEGSATITASVDGISASVSLTVFQEVDLVFIQPFADTLTALGDTTRFRAFARDANDNPITDVEFIWLSEDHNVGTIDADGLATATGSGEATITAAARGVPGTGRLHVAQERSGLGFLTQPSDVLARFPISPAIQIAIQDAGGSRVRSAQNAVTLLIEDNPGGGVLFGTETVNAVDGVATFSGISINRAGANYTLRAVAEGLDPAVSGTFDISYVLYGVNPEDNSLSIIDRQTGEVTVIGALSTKPGSLDGPVALSVRPQDLTPFAWINDTGRMDGVPAKVDVCSGVATQFGFGEPLFDALAFAPDGTLFALNNALFRIPVIGEGNAFVGDMGIQVATAEFDDQGTLHAVAENEWYTVDTETASADFVRSVGSEFQRPVSGIAFDAVRDIFVVALAKGSFQHPLMFDFDPFDGSVDNVVDLSSSFAPTGLGFAPPCVP